MTYSNVNNNKASNYGGGIFNDQDTFTITSSNLKSNTANKGGAIYNAYSGTIEAHNNQIYGNSAYEIECYGGTVDAENNWWGSDTDPSNKVHTDLGMVDVTPWLHSAIDLIAPTASATPPGGYYNSSILHKL